MAVVIYDCDMTNSLLNLKEIAMARKETKKFMVFNGHEELWFSRRSEAVDQFHIDGVSIWRLTTNIDGYPELDLIASIDDESILIA